MTYDAKKVKMVKAMEYIARQVNDEEIFDYWLMEGVADGDIDFGDTEYNVNDSELLESYIDDEYFSELMRVFLNLMVAARKSGGLYCAGVVSK